MDRVNVELLPVADSWWKPMLAAPALSPNTVIRSGSPPNDEMWSLIQRSASSWSFRPKFPARRYITDLSELKTALLVMSLRSADNPTCLVKRSRNHFGDRRFATAGPTLWNSLPEQLRQPDIIFGQFKRSLKSFMFG